MLRAQRVAGSGKLRLLVVAMPEGEDPAEMLALDGGEERFRRLLAEAVDLPVFHVRAILADADLETPAGRDRALDEVAPVMKAMGDTIIRQELISEVADRLETDPAMVGRRLSAAQMPKRDEPAPRPAPVGAPAGEPGDAGPSEDGEEMGPVPDSELSAPRQQPRGSTVEERREDSLLAMCIAKPDLGAEYISRLTQAHMVAPRARRALEWLRANLKDPLKDLPRADDELFTEVSRLKLIAEQQPAEEKSMELSWLMIERARIDREIAELRRGVEAEPAEGEAATEPEQASVIPFERVVELQRERARIADAIASRGG
jgi:DNA primase